MLSIDLEGGKYRLQYDGNELSYVTSRCRSFVCDDDLQGILLALMRENLSMKDKFDKMLTASNEATRKTVCKPLPVSCGFCHHRWKPGTYEDANICPKCGKS